MCPETSKTRSKRWTGQDCTGERGPGDGDRDDTTPTKWQTMQCTETLLDRWMVDSHGPTAPRPTQRAANGNGSGSGHVEQQADRERRAVTTLR